MELLSPVRALPHTLWAVLLLALAPLAGHAGPASLDVAFGAGRVTAKFDNHTDYGEAVVVQGDGKILLAGRAGNDAGYSGFGLVRYNPDGLVDTTFNGTGKVRTVVGDATYAEASALALLPDGRIVAAGNNGDVAVARYHADGSLDTTFNGTGIVTTAYRSWKSRARAVAVQPDGKIVVAGSYSATVNDTGILIIRYNADGSLDTTFNGTGIVAYNPSQGSEAADGVALQADGRIVVVGTLLDSAGYETFVTLRYNANGKLDTTFNGTGIVVTDFDQPTYSTGSARSVRIQSNGKIVVGGEVYFYYSGGYDFGVARYNTNGSLDTTFNGTGLARVNFSITASTYGIKSYDFGEAVALQPDGKIVLAGYTIGQTGGPNYYAGYSVAAARLNANGSLDTTFHGTGTVKTTVGSGISSGSAVALSGAKIVVVGSAFNGTHYAAATVVYNADGSLDTTFHPIGKVNTGVGVGDDSGRAMALQTDGKILVAGNDYNGSNWDFALVRYLPDGTRDEPFNPSYSASGKLTADFGNGDDSASSVVVQPDGKILVGGTTHKPGQHYSLALARYNANGSKDTTFHTTGFVLTDLASPDPDAGKVAVQPDGKILLTGTASSGGTYVLALLRYHADGSLDTTFNGTGKVTTKFIEGGAYGRDVALQPDGKIVVAADLPGSGEGFATVRYNANGSLDTTFNGTGKAITRVGSSYTFVHGLVVQPDKKILLAAEAFDGGRKVSGLVRYNADGSRDATFTSIYGSGVVITNVGTGDFLGGGLALQPNDKIVVSGTAVNGADNDVALLRYTSAGAPDQTFGGTGQVTTTFSGAVSGEAVAVQADGKIVVAGTTFNGGNDDFAVLRYVGGR